MKMYSRKGILQTLGYKYANDLDYTRGAFLRDLKKFYPEIEDYEWIDEKGRTNLDYKGNWRTIKKIVLHFENGSKHEILL